MLAIPALLIPNANLSKPLPPKPTVIVAVLEYPATPGSVVSIWNVLVEIRAVVGAFAALVIAVGLTAALRYNL